jgi:hypothetical protein
MGMDMALGTAGEKEGVGGELEKQKLIIRLY